jgi:hypothetical protein
MKPQTMIAALIAAIALVAGCASPDARHGSNDSRYVSARSNDGYYGVIDAIESGAVGHDGNGVAKAGSYFIRVRFDDRTYQTVAQASLNGLRVGDSVRIENESVRRY